MKKSIGLMCLLVSVFVFNHLFFLERAKASPDISEIVYLGNEYRAEFYKFSKFWIDEEWQLEYEDDFSIIKHGENLNVDFNKNYDFGIFGPKPQSLENDCNFFLYKGEIFYLGKDGNSNRELISYNYLDGIGWSQTGIYEIDFYFNCISLVKEKTLFKKIFALLKPQIAYASVSGEYIGTIRFVISKEEEIEECCSNVIFIPGIKGSVLKKQNLLTYDTLWPPSFFSNDVPQLALNDDGESINNIKVDGILNNFYTTPIYSEFSSFMDDLKNDEIIKEWLPLAYDWRYSPGKILADGIKTINGNINPIEKIEEIAERSKTKKVTIIAHSMGGLLGKAIIKELENQNKTNIIDSFIMVGSPQLGTPQAIASLLHGDGEGIPNNVNVIAKRSDMRAVGRNMQSAYNLLPSKRYFTEVLEPVAVFGNYNFTENWRNLWGESINAFTELQSFASGTDGRTRPLEKDMLSPEILRSDLLTKAENFHNEFDDYNIPSNIRVVQIAGWGIPTLKAIKYKEEHSKPYYTGQFTVEGDKTVIYPSAISSNGEVYYLNLSRLNTSGNGNDFEHRDLVSTVPVQNMLSEIIKNEAINETDFILAIKPDPINEESKLIVSTHSPVILGAYDANGKFTGIVQNQDPTADFLETKEEIPGSTFFALGDSQYIFLPKTGSYNFVFKGIGEGPATVEISEFKNDTTNTIVKYSDIPITETLQAQFEVVATEPNETQIQIDNDGDGVIDETVLPDSDEKAPSLSELIQSLKEKIKNLNVKNSIKKNLEKKIENLEKKIEKKKNDKKFLEKLEKNINKKVAKEKIESASADEILNILEKIEAIL